MATKLYFRSATYSGSGTFPTGYVDDGGGVGWQDPKATFVLRQMLTTPGSSQTSTSISTAASSSLTRNPMGCFCSLPLSGAQTVGGGTLTLNAADRESSTNANFFINSCTIVVWRPSTGAIVGTVREKSQTLGGFGALEPTAASAIQVSHCTVASTGVSAADGDVIVITVGSTFQQGMATAYTCEFFFNGSTENTTENTVVTNHASFIQFTENLTFQTPAGITQKQKSSHFF